MIGLYWCESIQNHAVFYQDVHLLHLIKKEGKRQKSIKEVREGGERKGGKEGKKRTGVPWI